MTGEDKVKLVINTCYGGFGLSKAAMDMYMDKKYEEWHRKGDDRRLED